MPDSLEEMAYAEAIRGLAAQEVSLNALRTRSATVLSSGSLVFALFTAASLGKHPVTGWIIASLIFFAALAFTAVYVLWPRTFRFTIDVTALNLEEDDAKAGATATTVSEISRDWAYWTTKNFEANQDIVDCLTNIYTGGLVALGLEVVTLGLALIFR